ncbi:hypothetical protein ACJX0J_020991, partial [Zea mays]
TVKTNMKSLIERRKKKVLSSNMELFFHEENRVPFNSFFYLMGHAVQPTTTKGHNIDIYPHFTHGHILSKKRKVLTTSFQNGNQKRKDDL